MYMFCSTFRNPNVGESGQVDVGVEWPKYGQAKRYLDLQTSAIQVKFGYQRERCHFWNEEYPAIARGKVFLK